MDTGFLILDIEAKIPAHVGEMLYWESNHFQLCIMWKWQQQTRCHPDVRRDPSFLGLIPLLEPENTTKQSIAKSVNGSPDPIIFCHNVEMTGARRAQISVAPRFTGCMKTKLYVENIQISTWTSFEISNSHCLISHFHTVSSIRD